MSNKTNKKKNGHSPAKATIEQVFESRTGGQIALQGYSYQFLYTCLLILSSSNINTEFQLEGIEDIDQIKYGDSQSRTHIQLKYSTVRQNASFMDSVLKNFLEVYLIEPDRYFKLVYDFDLADGNLSKWISGKLDKSSMVFWKTKVEGIKKSTPHWNWECFVFDDFIKHISFENVKKTSLEKKIEDSLIVAFSITTDNICLYANSLKILCFDKMNKRQIITHNDLKSCIESTKFFISRGSENPAHSWIQQLHFTQSEHYSSDYYEGKKATPADIANNLPIARPIVEGEILNSIRSNTITIIKTSSGQGKTTLALRAMLTLSNEYTPYQLICCNNEAELCHIVEYFHMRTRVGEKPLILLDNLDAHLSEWNMLAQLMQMSVTYHYKIIVTSREHDWYNYSGDTSNLHSYQIIKPVLSEEEAKAIFNLLKNGGKIHPNITDWSTAWYKIADRQLLIEYIYLLTHGEMLSERLSAQIRTLGKEPEAKIKFEILRNVCFADICGIKIETKALLKELSPNSTSDIGEILRSLTDEFLVHISTEGDHIEGLHPVRSKHIVDYLHLYTPLDETALSVAKIADPSDISVLFSHYPTFRFNGPVFYSNIVDLWWNLSDLSRFVKALRGAFSGGVLLYLRENESVFDDVFKHGGLVLVAADLCPFSKFEEYDQNQDTLDKLAEIMPTNANIQYLIQRRNSLPKIKIDESDIFWLSSALYEKLKGINFTQIDDLTSFAIIVDWLYNINPAFNLTPYISLDKLWEGAEHLPLTTVNSLMYSSFCGNRDAYLGFVHTHLSTILTYLKHKTNSHRIQVNNHEKKIKVEYLFPTSNLKQANTESVSRLTEICRMLPIFDFYCSDAIKPHLDIMDALPLPDDAHKEMPIGNLIITFRQDFNGLWLKTIQSNYEFDSVYSWINYWFDVRKSTCDLLQTICSCMHKLLGKKALNSDGAKFDRLHQHYNQILIAPSCPREHRPFEPKFDLPKQFNEAKGQYFASIQNFANAFVDFLHRKEQQQRSAVYNLKTAMSELPSLQKFFDSIQLDAPIQKKHFELCKMENIVFDTYVCCEYYISHFPNQRFSKYAIKPWFLSWQQTKVDLLKNSLIGLTTFFEPVYPTRAYHDNIFLNYPILLPNFDLTNEYDILLFVEHSLPFKDSNFDYLTLLASNKTNEIQPIALQFSKALYRLIATNPEDIGDHNWPYPVEVTHEMLDCFEEHLELPKTEQKELWIGCIGDVGEQLWLYSKNQELLVDQSDRKYLATTLSHIRQKIEKMLAEIMSHSTADIYNYLNDLTESIFDGMVFGDKEYNEFIEHVKTFSL